MKELHEINRNDDGSILYSGFATFVYQTKINSKPKILKPTPITVNQPAGHLVRKTVINELTGKVLKESEMNLYSNKILFFDTEEQAINYFHDQIDKCKSNIEKAMNELNAVSSFIDNLSI